MQHSLICWFNFNPNSAGGLIQPALFSDGYFSLKLKCWRAQISWLFQYTYGEPPYTLSEAPNSLKKGFWTIFVGGGLKIRILKFGFLAFFEAKMTKNDIPNPKLIDANDNQPFYIRILCFFWVFLILIWKSWYFSFKRSGHKNCHF